MSRSKQLINSVLVITSQYKTWSWKRCNSDGLV